MTDRHCEIEDCDRPFSARGWCSLHYERWRVHGDPLTTKIRPAGAPRPTCSVEWCEDLVRCRGFCARHYRRFMSHGDPEAGPADAGAPLRWLKDMLVSAERTPCWEWPFARNSDGYGTLWFEGDPWKAHRLALVLDGVPVPPPPGNHGLHRCDNPPCCNPAHLTWGTPRANTHDAMARGRRSSRVGTSNGRARLTESDVVAIRDRAARGDRLSELAAEYGMSDSAVRLAVNGRNWSHLPGALR